MKKKFFIRLADSLKIFSLKDPKRSIDESISGSGGKQLFSLFILCGIVIFILWIPSFFLSCLHNKTELDYNCVNSLDYVLQAFVDPGVIDHEHFPKPWEYFLIFIGMFVLVGLLIGTISNIFAQRISKIERGEVSYKWNNHYVIFGYGELTDCLIKNLLEKDKKTEIVISTFQDATRARIELKSELDDEDYKNVFVVSGDFLQKEHIEELRIDKAKEVYIIGDDSQRRKGNDWNKIECLNHISENNKNRQDYLPVYLHFDSLNAYSAYQKYTNTSFSENNILLRPFNFCENWARLLWGHVALKDFPKDDKNKPLEFLKENWLFAYKRKENEWIRMTEEQHIHIVIVGFNTMGKALLMEALRLCHFPNYKQDDPSTKTKITVIDNNKEKISSFQFQYPKIKEQIEDIDVEYLNCDFESAEIQKLLIKETQEEKVWLSIAICYRNSNKSLLTALNMPQKVYYDIDGNEAILTDTRIYVRQEQKTILEQEKITGNKKYSHVYPFGMQKIGLSKELLDDTNAQITHLLYSLYDLFDEKGTLHLDLYDLFDEEGKFSHAKLDSSFSEGGKFSDTNSDSLSKKEQEKKDKYKKLKRCIDTNIFNIAGIIPSKGLTYTDCKKKIMEANIVNIKSALNNFWVTDCEFECDKFSNRHLSDMFYTYNFFNKHVKKLNPNTEVEHLRWNAERTIYGFEQNDNFKDKVYLTHNLIIPNEKIEEKSPDTKKYDERNIELSKSILDEKN